MSGSRTVTFSVSVDAHLYDCLALYARRHGMKRRHVMANALESYLVKPKISEWVYEPVLVSLLEKLAPTKVGHIQTKGELVTYLVACKDWPHDTAENVVRGLVELDVVT